MFVEERTVDVHIRRLRQVLVPSGHDKLIETVRGMGYRFRPKPADALQWRFVSCSAAGHGIAGVLRHYVTALRSNSILLF